MRFWSEKHPRFIIVCLKTGTRPGSDPLVISIYLERLLCLHRPVQRERKQPEHDVPGGGSHPPDHRLPAPGDVPPGERASVRQRRADLQQRLRPGGNGIAERRQAEEDPRGAVQTAG